MKCSTEALVRGKYEIKRMDDRELVIIPVHPIERELVAKIVDEQSKRYLLECGGKWTPILSLLPDLKRLIGLKDGGLHVIDWNSYIDAFEDAIKEDVYFVPVVGNVRVNTTVSLENSLSSIVSNLLELHACRAAHNALTLLVALRRLIEYLQAGLKDQNVGAPNVPF